jgi:hypothetical protein
MNQDTVPVAKQLYTHHTKPYAPIQTTRKGLRVGPVKCRNNVLKGTKRNMGHKERKMDEDKLTGVFEMLVSRLSDLEMEVRDMKREMSKPVKTVHTERWIRFFNGLGMETKMEVPEAPEDMRMHSFIVTSLGIEFRVVVYQGTENTYDVLGKLSDRLQNKINRPFLVVDTPIFANTQKRESWNEYLYREEENVVSILGMLGWEFEVDAGCMKFGLPGEPPPEWQTIFEKTAVQVVEEDGKFGLVWSGQYNEGWLYSSSLSGMRRPFGFESMPYGRGWRDKLGIWRDVEAIWSGRPGRPVPLSPIEVALRAP